MTVVDVNRGGGGCMGRPLPDGRGFQQTMWPFGHSGEDREFGGNRHGETGWGKRVGHEEW